MTTPEARVQADALVTDPETAVTDQQPDPGKLKWADLLGIAPEILDGRTVEQILGRDSAALPAEVVSAILRDPTPDITSTEPAIDWKTRALRAEAAVYHALWMRPLSCSGYRPPPTETAAEMATRFRQHLEDHYPDLIVRDEHRRIEVFKIADSCDCDPDAEDYDDHHCESSGDGEYLCAKSFLGYVCGSCSNEEAENGPPWKPEGVLWPCPPIAALDGTPADGSQQ